MTLLILAVLMALVAADANAQIDSIRGARETCTDGLAAGHACSDMDLSIIHMSEPTRPYLHP